MADNTTIKNGSGGNVSAATDELSDSSQSPKVTLLSGDGTPAAYRIDQSLGLAADAAATTDTGAFSLISLFKRLLEKHTAQLPAALDAGGNMKVAIQIGGSSTTIQGSADNSDAVGASATASRLLTVNRMTVWDAVNSTWNRLRGNTTGLIVIPPAGWVYAPPVGGIDNSSTAVAIKAAAGAGVRIYLTSLQIDNDTLGASTEIAIRDGAGGTVLWRGKLQTAAGSRSIVFANPIASTANTLLEFLTLTAVTGDVLVSAQGYTGP